MVRRAPVRPQTSQAGPSRLPKEKLHAANVRAESCRDQAEGWGGRRPSERTEDALVALAGGLLEAVSTGEAPAEAGGGALAVEASLVRVAPLGLIRGRV